MKKEAFALLLTGMVFLLGCEPSVPDGNDGLDSEDVSDDAVECATATDCVVGGCSGTVCQPKDAEPIFTTCEYKDEYACFEAIDCGCVAGKCQWETTPEFKGCVADART